MEKRKVILSTVGTSLLTNQVAEEQRKEFFNMSNLKEKDYSDVLIKSIEEIKIILNDKLQKATELDARKLSAELNGILGIYGSFPKASQDVHILITTDTYQGMVTAKIIEDYITAKGFSVLNYTPKNLTTENKKKLHKWYKRFVKMVG